MTEEKGRIHIRGIGHAEQTPDLAVLSLTLSAQNRDYSAALKIGGQQIEMLREAIVASGFKANDLKTTKFNVEAKYDREEYKDGSSKRYRDNFIGFECRHDLKLSFDFSNKRLSAAVDAVAKCLAQPKISIAFTMKDFDALNDKILKSAARDARRKAKSLCAALGVKLGRLIDINYSPDKIQSTECILAAEYAPSEKNSFNVVPEEIIASDTVDFLWEIE